MHMNFQAANVLVSIQRHVNAVTPVWGLFLFAQSLSQVHINIKNSNWGSLFHLQVHLLHPEVSLQLHIFLRGLQCQVVFLAVNTSSNKFKTNQCMQSHLKCVKTKQKHIHLVVTPAQLMRPGIGQNSGTVGRFV